MLIVKHMSAAPNNGTRTGWHMPLRIDKEACKQEACQFGVPGSDLCG